MYKFYQSLVLAIWSYCVAVAAAQTLPEDRMLTYHLYSVPNDSTSTLSWTIELQISVDSINGSIAKWAVTSVRVTDNRPGPTQGRQWEDLSPVLATIDGLWHVIHADPQNPDVSEFWNLPFLHRVAGALTSGYGDMTYQIQSTSVEPPANGNPPRLAYRLVVGSDPDPVAFSADEPVLVQSEPTPG